MLKIKNKEGQKVMVLKDDASEPEPDHKCKCPDCDDSCGDKCECEEEAEEGDE